MAYRVVQWGTGAVGVEAIRGILDHPDPELVGVKVYSEEKAGTDAGVLAGGDPIVLYAPRHPSVDEATALLASGANLITTAFAFHPARMEPRDRDRLRQACAEGNSSLHGTGLNSGNLGVVVPLALTGISWTIEQHQEADINRPASPFGERQVSAVSCQAALSICGAAGEHTRSQAVFRPEWPGTCR